jgi:hypothetical protein
VHGIPDLHQPKMLQEGRMAGLVKLHRSARPRGERQVRAGLNVLGYQIDEKE